LSAFTVSPADTDCTFDYDLVNNDDSAIDPSFLTFTEGTITMTVDGDNTINGNDYDLKLKAFIVEAPTIDDEALF